MRNIILTVCAVFVFTGCVSSNSNYAVPKNVNLVTQDIQGTWTGNAKQFNNNTEWSVKVNIVDGKYTISYPSLNCGGVLTLLKSTKTQVTFREKITYGKLKCVDNGIATIKLTSSNTSEYKWYYNNGKHGASGFLEKR
ncbi:hypothetical protein [Poseidonibacter ostreae]|uniref:Lipocalin-like domain-containing protein n=1 Tax=Poseidonibacter ostreae TaxID=2654171 RepID=A0A6L4WQ27_9BACT|nr:hypothetical protein [Poseidonibacter ostreae]KAB7886193.1 hypothetical protein GBG19_12680 [Poseidonibacter ostreae]